MENKPPTPVEDQLSSSSKWISPSVGKKAWARVFPIPSKGALSPWLPL